MPCFRCLAGAFLLQAGFRSLFSILPPRLRPLRVFLFMQPARTVGCAVQLNAAGFTAQHPAVAWKSRYIVWKRIKARVLVIRVLLKNLDDNLQLCDSQTSQWRRSLCASGEPDYAECIYSFQELVMDKVT